MLERPRDHFVTGIALAATSAVAFGTLAIFAKLAYRHDAAAIPLLATRFSIAALLLVGFNHLSGRSMALDRGQAIRLMLLGGFGYAFESTLYFAALGHASAAVVGLIFYSYPLWTSLGAIATRLEPFHPRLLVALVVGTAGILLIFSLPHEGLVGPLLALAAAFAVTVYYLFAQVLVRGVDAHAAATYTAAGAALTLTGASAVTRQAIPWAAWPYAFGLGLVTAVAFVCLYGAVARIGSAKTSIAHMLEPVTTVILAAVILGNNITSRVAIGAALIVAALPILALQRRTEVPAPDG
jgi:drug/metabolite transporter (DMT)-like permease